VSGTKFVKAALTPGSLARTVTEIAHDLSACAVFLSVAVLL
jgi:hypothetical protein